MPELSQVHIDKSLAEEKKKPKTRKCPSCGSELSDKELSANYCDSCDTSLGSGSADMSKLSTKDREKLSEDDFAGPNRSYPIVDQSDVHDAASLIGKADDPDAVKRKIISIAKRKGFDIPDAWKGKAKMYVEFSDTATPRLEGNKVIRTGLWFQCGDYPDKNFSLTAEEADNAVTTFKPVQLNIEHIPSIFDGKLGEVRKIWRDGEKDIVAEYAIPMWLHEVTGAEPLKVSAEWNRENKTPIGTGLVLNPRVQSAAMMAAFSHALSESDFSDRGVMRIHDTAVGCGAECGGKSYFSEIAKFMTPEDLKAIQKAHDVCNGDGKHCDMYQSKNQLYSTYSATTSNTSTTNTTTTEARTTRAEKEKRPMSIKDKIASLFQRAGVPKEEVDKELSEVKFKDDDEMTDEEKKKKKDEDMEKAKMTAASDAAFSAMQTELQAVQANLAAQKALFDQQQETVKAQQAVLEAQQAQFAEAAKTAQFAADSRTIEDLKLAGKLTPAMADKWTELAKENPTAFAATVKILEEQSPLFTLNRGMLAVAGAGNDPSTPDADKIDTMAKAKMKENPDLSYTAAFSAVCKENPGLAQSYRASVGG